MPSGEDRFRAALDFIDARSNFARGFITSPASSTGGHELDLVRTRALLDVLGSPDRAYPIIHIAGSKGKGSTAAFAAAIGKAAGYRTGLSTSPHLHSFRERMSIDGSPIARGSFGDVGMAVLAATNQLELSQPASGSVTAFEIVTVMGFLAFAEAGCEVVIAEVGLGGAYDATNVVLPAVSIITRLDLEHTNVLGHTIEEIAANKAGIIKPGVPVVTVAQDPQALQVIEQAAHTRSAPLLVAGTDFGWSGSWRTFDWWSASRHISGLQSTMPGNHQMENASGAIAAWDAHSQLGLCATDSAIREGVENAFLPGRFERVEASGRIWILDGAHTPVAASALAETLMSEFAHPVGMIAGMLRDKHPLEFFSALAPAVSDLIVTSPRNPRAIPADELVRIARSANSQAIASENLDTSIDAAQAEFSEGLPIVITGSFTLVAEARDRLGLANAD